MSYRWRRFLFALAVRFVAGAFLALLVSVPLTFFAGSRGPGRRRSLLVDGVQAGQYRFLVRWFGGWALAGGIVAVVTIPRWQTPWHKYRTLSPGDDHDGV